MFDVFSSRGREHVEHDPTVTRKVRLRDIGALRSMKSGSDKFNDQGPAAEAQRRECKVLAPAQYALLGKLMERRTR
jgi:hypothetical protein